MKNINFFLPEKYGQQEYLEITNTIYKFDEIFVSSITFEQEPYLGEGSNSQLISQYPLEDILDYFDVYISDFYSELNKNDYNICYLEFASPNIDKIESLNKVIGKHIYKKIVEINDNNVEKLIIE